MEGGEERRKEREKIGKERNGGREELQSNRLSTKDLFAGYRPATDLLTQLPPTYLSLHPSEPPAALPLAAGHPLPHLVSGKRGRKGEEEINHSNYLTSHSHLPTSHPSPPHIPLPPSPGP